MTSSTRSLGLLLTLLCGPVGALPLLGGCTLPAPFSDASLMSDAAGGGGDASGGADFAGGKDAASKEDAAGTPDAAGTRDGGTKGSGDCTTDAQCAPGKCVALTPGGFRVCTTPVAQATMCTHGAFDKCCKTSDCKAGQQCLVSPLIPVCTGVFMNSANVCGSDNCASAANCQNNDICVPAGALGFKVSGCLAAPCHLDSDCTAHAGGVCAPVSDPCCGDAIGLYCVYPGTGCRKNSDCKSGQHCGVSGSAAQCVSGPPVCPA